MVSLHIGLIPKRVVIFYCQAVRQKLTGLAMIFVMVI